MRPALSRDGNGAVLNHFSRREVLKSTTVGALALLTSSRVLTAQQAAGARRLTTSWR